MRYSAWNPDRALGRDHIACCISDDRHDAGTGVKQLDALMRVLRIPEASRVLIGQADDSPAIQIDINGAFHGKLIISRRVFQ